MKINGQKITEIQFFDEKEISKLSEEGMKMQRFNPSQIDSMEEALIIAATNFVYYNILEKKGGTKGKGKKNIKK